MGIFSRGPVVPPTLTERFNIASAMHGSAVSVFEDIAAQLREAEAEYRNVAAEAQEEITRLAAVRNDAFDAAHEARNSADAVLNLSRGTKQ